MAQEVEAQKNDGTAEATREPRAVVAGHGTFAEGIASAVQQIAGRGDALRSVTNAGLAPPQIEAAIASALDESGASIVFTDLPAGSCTMAARRLQRARPGLVVVTGVNLGTVLEFIFRAEGASAFDAAQAAAEKGRASLVVQGS